jgi:glycosyltransferase involved in cell wall biosynthesis
VYDPAGVPPELRAWDIRTTALQRFPGARHYSRMLLPLMPWAFERLDFSGFDVVITTSSAFSKNVVAPTGTPNVCYCHTPPRYLWDLHDEYGKALVVRRPLEPLVQWLRARDLSAAARVDEFVANSYHVADRIARTYQRTATVFYLVVSRLVRYKRVDLAIQACNALRRPLFVVGSGPERPALQAMAGPTIKFLGSPDDATVADLFARCRALVFPGLEDFGITPVEAQAAGRPVIAFRAGGALETVVDRSTGVFFESQTVSAVTDAIERLERTEMDPAACRANAMRFDASVFRQGMRTIVDNAMATSRSA